MGDKRRLTIPPQMAYGSSGVKGAIPPNGERRGRTEEHAQAECRGLCAMRRLQRTGRRAATWPRKRLHHRHSGAVAACAERRALPDTWGTANRHRRLFVCSRAGCACWLLHAEHTARALLTRCVST